MRGLSTFMPIYNEDRVAIAVTPEMLRKNDRPGPRYTSYPTAPMWRESFGSSAYRQALKKASLTPDDPLALYIHIPFCQERCAFCGCNVIIGRKEGLADTYLDYVEKELSMLATGLGNRRGLAQMHWGGGTPTFLDLDQIQRLHNAVSAHFAFLPEAEVALEMDPRVTTEAQVGLLRDLGFNRVSMGVQDLDPEVQCAIHRNQTEEQTRHLFGVCRQAGFTGINIDLVYGLPSQRPERWKDTVQKILDIRPDRLALYSYAYLPDRLRNQKHIEPSELPDTETKYALFAEAREGFVKGGYVAIGMDHFAMPHDELCQAVEQRRLYRNFMGYTVTHAPDMVAVGTSAIGEVGGCFAQNEKKLSRYYEAIDEGEFPTACGCELTDDDRIRAWVIRELMCNFHIDFAAFESRFGVAFESYFERERESLAGFEQDRMIAATDAAVDVLPLGQIFVRNIAMAFDAYLKRPDSPVRYSRTV
ncbi:MAG: oxygen-independent coproporphyrinogen III oxidase [Candidatus Hydrogenedentota bacterium]